MYCITISTPSPLVLPIPRCHSSSVVWLQTIHLIQTPLFISYKDCTALPCIYPIMLGPLRMH